MANYPTSLDTLTNPSSSDTMMAVDHASQHANVNDAVEALEAKLGIGASTAVSGKLLIGTGVGQSAWSKDAPAGTIVGDTDSQTLTNKTLTSPTINTAIINNPTLNTDTIAEYTAAAGVTIDGLLIKDGKLATNNSVVTSNYTDDSVTASKIDWAAIGAGSGIWGEELGRTTLGSAGDTISVTSIAARKYLCVLFFYVNTGSLTPILRFNNDSGATYANRYSLNGAADTTAVSQTSLVAGTGGISSPQIGVFNIVNVLAQEKLLTGQVDYQNTAGAGTTPGRLEVTGKWANTAAQINRIDVINTGAGDFAIGSEVVVVGHN